METYEGWAADPMGAHETRYFSQGRPTRLVRNGSVERFEDRPLEPPPSPTPPTESYWAFAATPTAPAPPGAGSGQSAPGPGGGAPPDEFTGRTFPTPGRPPRKGLAVGLTVVLVAALAGSLVFVLGGAKSAEAAVIDSVNSTMADRTAHVSMNLSVDTPSGTVRGTGTGAIDFSENALQLQMTIGAADRQVQMQAVFLDGSVYEEIPDLDLLIPGKSWISIDLSTLGVANGQDPSALGTGNNPAAMLRLLAQQGNTVVSLGSSSIGGTPVQGYSVTLDAAAIKARLAHANLPSWMTDALTRVNIADITDKVYVDGAGLLRRLSTDLTESGAAAGNVNVDESLDFSDYGTPVAVTAPPSDRVVSFGQFMQEALAAQGSSLPS